MRIPLPSTRAVQEPVYANCIVVHPLLIVVHPLPSTRGVQEPVYANFIDPLLPGRSTGRDMPAALLGALGPASPAGFSSKVLTPPPLSVRIPPTVCAHPPFPAPAGFSSKPSWAGRTPAELGAAAGSK